MRPPAVVLCATPAGGAAARAVAASFEEEGVPVRIEPVASGTARELARRAARGAPLGLGVGSADDGLAAVLTAAPGAVYLEAADGARAFGRAAARVVSRRPL